MENMMKKHTLFLSIIMLFFNSNLSFAEDGEYDEKTYIIFEYYYALF